MRVTLAAVAVAVLCLGAVLLFVFNPSQHGFYPFCLFHKITGLQCPGCGSLRALHQMLHGNLVEAFRLNALLTLSLPFVGWLMLRALSVLLGKEVKPLNPSPAWLWGGLVVLVVFGVVRNL